MSLRSASTLKGTYLFTFTLSLEHASKERGLVNTYRLFSNLGSSKLYRSIFSTVSEAKCLKMSLAELSLSRTHTHIDMHKQSTHMHANTAHTHTHTQRVQIIYKHTHTQYSVNHSQEPIYHFQSTLKMNGEITFPIVPLLRY